jgi:hypothetical protein
LLVLACGMGPAELGALGLGAAYRCVCLLSCQSYYYQMLLRYLPH